MASVSTPSANEPAAKDLILVHTVKLKPIIKAHFSGRMESSGIRDVCVRFSLSEKSRLKVCLHREPPILGLVEILSGSLYR